MADDDLYQGLLLDHFKNPRRHAKLEPEAAMWEERNPACGDLVRFRADLSAGRLDGLEHDSRGCAISVASASILAERLDGKPAAEARTLAASVCDLLRGDDPVPEDAGDALAALATVRRFPMRVKCALLPWVGLVKWLGKRD